MSRFRVILVAVLLSVALTVLFVGSTLLLSWKRSMEAEQSHLTAYANWTLMRAGLAMQDATRILYAMEQSGFHDCSDSHIEAMRRMAINSRVVGEVGFYQDDRLACTSWGRVPRMIKRHAPDYYTQGGIGVNIRVTPMISHGKTMIGLEHGSYNVLMDPVVLVDVLVDNEMSLALTSEKGEILASLHHPGEAQVRESVAHPGPGKDAQFLYSSSKENGWIAVAIEKRDYMQMDFHRQQMVLLPIGCVLALLSVLAIVWASRRRLSPLVELEIAIKRKEFLPWYQPIVDLKTGRCIGAEALVRWKQSDGSMLGPDRFVPLAEQSGLMSSITEQMIQHVVGELHEVLIANPSMHIAINLTAADIEDGRTLEILSETLKKYGVRAQSIWLEATERGFIRAVEASTMLLQARELGHTVAIDDFGTGYSSLSLLHSLPLDALKIDKSFIEAIGKQSATSTVVKHIIEMAVSLNLMIIAEGVETEEQAAYLRENDVAYSQGWLFAKAMSRSDFLEYYSKNANI